MVSPPNPRPPRRAGYAWLAVFSLACNGVIQDPGAGVDRPEPDAPPAAEPGSEFACEGEHRPGPAPLRRLTVPEYVASIEAIFGTDVEARAVAEIPPDVRADGFSNTASGLVVDVAHVEAFATLAREAVASVGDMDGFVSELGVDCRAFEASCERELIEAASLRVYRGPARDEDVASLSPVFDAVEAEGGDFLEGASFVLEAMLQSPRFLYKVERQLGGSGPVRRLDGYELASRLSYLVTGGPPDDALLATAADGTIVEDAVIEAEVRRLLDAPEARETSLRYVGDWLHLDRLDHLARESETFPGWDPALGDDMKAETLAYAEHLLWEERTPLTELFAAQRSFMTGRLAAWYGLEPAEDGVAEYDLSGVPERGGLLTQGSLLTIGGPSASMVHRGKFLLENVLCGRVEDPPPGVDTTPMEPMEGFTRRDEAQLRVDSPACGGCHGQMDTLAFGLEQFDGAGAHHVTDEFGNELREDGSVKFPGDPTRVEFATIEELMDVLAGSERVRDCMSLKAAQFALGRQLSQLDGCALSQVRERFSESDGTYQELMVAIALSPMIRTIGAEE